MAAAASREAPVEQKSRHTENLHEENENVITREQESAVMNLVTKKMGTMVEEALDNVLLKTFQNAQRGVCFLVYNVLEQIMLQLPQN